MCDQVSHLNFNDDSLLNSFNNVENTTTFFNALDFDNVCQEHGFEECYCINNTSLDFSNNSLSDCFNCNFSDSSVFEILDEKKEVNVDIFENLTPQPSTSQALHHSTINTLDLMQESSDSSFFYRTIFSKNNLELNDEIPNKIHQTEDVNLKNNQTQDLSKFINFMNKTDFSTSDLRQCSSTIKSIIFNQINLEKNIKENVSIQTLSEIKKNVDRQNYLLANLCTYFFEKRGGA